MPAPKTDREQVVEAALELFRSQGYERTSIAQIGAACGLLKGSLYHYFRSKEALTLAVIERAIAEAWDCFLWIAYQEDKSLSARAEEMAAGITKYYEGRKGRCLVGRLSMELAESNPLFAVALRRFFDDCVSAFGALLMGGRSEADARHLAVGYASWMQGSLVLAGVGVVGASVRDVMQEFRASVSDEPPSGLPTNRLDKQGDDVAPPEQAAAE